MNTDTIINAMVQLASDTSNVLLSGNSPVHTSGCFIYDFWFWLSIAEALLIVILLVSRLKRKPKSQMDQIKSQVMSEGEIDFSNTMMSAFHSKDLYDKLKVKCHPDRFPQDDELNAIANSLFQQIVENKKNYKKLLELKDLAEKQLNINI